MVYRHIYPAIDIPPVAWDGIPQHTGVTLVLQVPHRRTLEQTLVDHSASAVGPKQHVLVGEISHKLLRQPDLALHRLIVL